MEKTIKDKHDDIVKSDSKEEDDDSQRIAPARKYSVLEDDDKSFIEDYKRIETF